MGNPDHVPFQSDFSASGECGGKAANTHMGNCFGYIQSAPCRSPFLGRASGTFSVLEAVSTMHE